MCHFLDYCPNTTFTIPHDETLDISSPFFPSYYPPNVDCFFQVTVEGLIPGEKGDGFIVVTFLTIDLAPGDYMTIGVGDDVSTRILLRLGARNGPRIGTINDTTMWIRFFANGVWQSLQGFEVQLRWSEDYSR